MRSLRDNGCGSSASAIISEDGVRVYEAAGGFVNVSAGTQEDGIGVFAIENDQEGLESSKVSQRPDRIPLLFFGRIIRIISRRQVRSGLAREEAVG
jgi:hypothetical protein